MLVLSRAAPVLSLATLSAIPLVGIERKCTFARLANRYGDPVAMSQAYRSGQPTVDPLARVDRRECESTAEWITQFVRHRRK